MEERKSKLISFAVLFALFLSAVAFASRYDRSENGQVRRQVKIQQKADAKSAKNAPLADPDHQ